MSLSNVKTALPFWLLMVIIWLVVALSMGRSQSMGLYLSPVTAALGTGREAFGLAMAMSQLMMGVFAPNSGAMIGRNGAGGVAAVCLLTTASGLWVMYAATSALWLLISGMLTGIGVSGTGLTAFVATIGRLAPPEKRLNAVASMEMAAGIAIFIALLGLFWLATIPLTSGLDATFFGTTWMSMPFGVVFLAHQVGAFLGVWLGGRIFDLTKSYATMWWISIGLAILAGLINWPIEERPVARLRALAGAPTAGLKS